MVPAEEFYLPDDGEKTTGILDRANARQLAIINKLGDVQAQGIRDRMGALFPAMAGGFNFVQGAKQSMAEEGRREAAAEQQAALTERRLTSEDTANTLNSAKAAHLLSAAPGASIGPDGKPSQTILGELMGAEERTALGAPERTEQEFASKMKGQKTEQTAQEVQTAALRQGMDVNAKTATYSSLERALDKNYAGVVQPDGTIDQKALAVADANAPALAQKFSNLPGGTDARAMIASARQQRLAKDAQDANTAASLKQTNPQWGSANALTTSLKADIEGLNAAHEAATNYDKNLSLTGDNETRDSAKKAITANLRTVGDGNEDIATNIESFTLPTYGHRAAVANQGVVDAYRKTLNSTRLKIQQLGPAAQQDQELQGTVESLRKLGVSLGVPEANTPQGFAKFIGGGAPGSLANKSRAQMNQESLTGGGKAPIPGANAPAGAVGAPTGTPGGPAGAIPAPGGQGAAPPPATPLNPEDLEQ